MNMVFKFGGTSLENTNKIKKVASFIKNFLERRDTKLIIVVSAMGKTTSLLETTAKNISKSPLPASLASLLVTGELISALLLSIALEELNIKTTILSAKDIPIEAKGDPLNSVITYIDKSTILSALDDSVVIVPGFQGVNQNQFVTLGRGGSDTTAVAIASLLSCKAYIFTDVNGYYTADPNNFKKTKLIKTICLSSALESAFSGAKVLDKRCLQIASKYKTKVAVCKSTFLKGTNLSFESFENYQVDTITCKNEITFVKNSSKKTKISQLENYLFSFCLNGETYYAAEKGEIVGGKTCNLITITGSGFNFYSDFSKKVQNVLNKYKISPIFYDLHPTFLKILLKEDPSQVVNELIKTLK